MLSAEPVDGLHPMLSATAQSLDHAQAYCRRVARSHYENFLIATCFVPRSLRQDFSNIYAYCRVADDLADESSDREQNLAMLDRWQEHLEHCYAGRATHPVFVALRETIHRFEIPIHLFADLLVAFRQDQLQTRYPTANDLLNYCRHSANPVGRLVLHLGRCHNDSTILLSDTICTGLQLTNFCQDVARDFAIGRVYLPQEAFQATGYTEQQLAAGNENDAWRRLMQIEVDWAESFLQAGWPLVRLVPKWLALDVAMFIEGGLEVLRQIRRNDYRVLSVRPTVSKSRQFMLLARMWTRHKLGKLRAAP